MAIKYLKYFYLRLLWFKALLDYTRQVKLFLEISYWKISILNLVRYKVRFPINLCCTKEVKFCVQWRNLNWNFYDPILKIKFQDVLAYCVCLTLFSPSPPCYNMRRVIFPLVNRIRPVGQYCRSEIMWQTSTYTQN